MSPFGSGPVLVSQAWTLHHRQERLKQQRLKQHQCYTAPPGIDHALEGKGRKREEVWKGHSEALGQRPKEVSMISMVDTTAERKAAGLSYGSDKRRFRAKQRKCFLRQGWGTGFLYHSVY